MNPLPQRYRIFDVCVASELPLPGLSRCDGESPDWTVTCPRCAMDDSAVQWFHSWESPDGRELMKSARQGGDYLLQIFDLAVFRILMSERRIEVFTLVDCPPTTLAHLLLDQVLPRVLCHQGRPVIHASAVLLTDGRVVAFTGPSGRGKSTLATAFHNAGHRVLADDCLLLDRKGDAVFAVSAYPSLRLWPDTFAALAEDVNLDKVQVSEMAHYTRKRQLLFEADGWNTTMQQAELSMLYLLEEPPDGAQDEAVRIRPVSGSTAIMALIEASFALDVVDQEAVRRNFEIAGSVAKYVPLARLECQWGFKNLPQVVNMIINFDPG